MEANQKIPEATLDTLARSFFKEAEKYGFKSADYVRFVNQILDYAMQSKNGKIKDSSHSDTANVFKHDGSAHTLPLSGARIRIRECAEADEKLMEEWLSDENGRFFMLSRLTARRMSCQDLCRDPANHVGTITLPDNTPIGTVAFLDLDKDQSRAELRKLIGDKRMRGKGYGKEATALWVAYGFNDLNLKKIYLNTFDTNLRNIRLNEELGFRVEGIMRNEVLIDGTYRDVLRMGMCRE